MTDEELDALSLRDLLQLQEDIHAAIRAQIRKQREAKEAASGIGRPALPGAPAEPAAPVVSPGDLERERDAWLARRGGSGGGGGARGGSSSDPGPSHRRDFGHTPGGRRPQRDRDR